jgi:energy-coupling factor transport system ATP-binding protein
MIYCMLCGFSLKRLLIASLKILPFLLFFSIFQMIFHPALPDEVRYTSWKWFMVTPSKLLFCLAAIIRTDAALAFISGFFVSTPEYDLMDGLNVLLTPLRLCRLPVRYLILVIEIIFRFIPLLVDEAVSILKTQAIRGGLGQVKGKLAKIKAVLPLIVPLIIQTIKRSEALADAITMRCFK